MVAQTLRGQRREAAPRKPEAQTRRLLWQVCPSNMTCALAHTTHYAKSLVSIADRRGLAKKIVCNADSGGPWLGTDTLERRRRGGAAHHAQPAPQQQVDGSNGLALEVLPVSGRKTWQAMPARPTPWKHGGHSMRPRASLGRPHIVPGHHGTSFPSNLYVLSQYLLPLGAAGLPQHVS